MCALDPWSRACSVCAYSTRVNYRDDREALRAEVDVLRQEVDQAREDHKRFEEVQKRLEQAQRELHSLEGELARVRPKSLRPDNTGRNGVVVVAVIAGLFVM